MNFKAPIKRPASLIALVVTYCLLLFQLAVLASEASYRRSNSAPNLLEVPKQEHGKKYGVILDCGSSGTRASIFVWGQEMGSTKLLSEIAPLRNEKGQPLSKKITPGLSNYASDAVGAFNYMRKIVEFITKKIPQESFKSTTIHIMATAGLRLLDKEDQTNVIDAVDYKSNFGTTFAGTRFSIISGTREGMYQWITVNSKSKRFEEVDGKFPNTVGIIEMGGASLQVAFKLPKGNNFHQGLTADALLAFQTSIEQPEIGREIGSYGNFDIFSTSFLGFGSNSVREAYVDLLINISKNDRDVFKKVVGFLRKQLYFKKTEEYTVNNPMNLKDPCLPKGAKEIRVKPCDMLEGNQTRTLGYNVDGNSTIFKVVLEGTGNYASCKKLVKLMLKTAKNEGLNCNVGEPCPMKLLGTSFVPFDEFEFYGLADFYYSTDALDKAGEYSHEAVVRRTKDICETENEELKYNFSDHGRDDSRVILKCFKAVWVDTFLIYGLKMPKEYRNFETIGQINGDALEWTLGAIIDKSAGEKS